MLTRLRTSLLLSCAAIATCLVPSVNADDNFPATNNQAVNSEDTPIAQVQTNESPEELAKALSQLQSIQQLQDVDPYNWSYEALKNLVEQYGCIVGYPDRTFRGDQPLTRYEFAAGLNACMQALERRMIEVIQAQGGTGNTNNTVSNPSVPQNNTEDIASTFNRAFYHNTGTFSDLYGLSGQFNGFLGWRTFPGSFVENLISRDSQLLQAVYQDVLDQTTASPRLRTQDLTNPFNTSLNENPDYLSPAQQSTSVTTETIIFEPSSVFR
jgi:hypothetical protein